MEEAVAGLRALGNEQLSDGRAEYSNINNNNNNNNKNNKASDKRKAQEDSEELPPAKRRQKRRDGKNSTGAAAASAAGKSNATGASGSKPSAEAFYFVRSFMNALLKEKPPVPKHKKLRLQSMEKRERKREVNRLSSQRKRNKEKEDMEKLNKNYEALCTASDLLRKDNEKLMEIMVRVESLKASNTPPGADETRMLLELFQELSSDNEEDAVPEGADKKRPEEVSTDSGSEPRQAAVPNSSAILTAPASAVTAAPASEMLPPTTGANQKPSAVDIPQALLNIRSNDIHEALARLSGPEMQQEVIKSLALRGLEALQSEHQRKQQSFSHNPSSIQHQTPPMALSGSQQQCTTVQSGHSSAVVELISQLLTNRVANHQTGPPRPAHVQAIQQPPAPAPAPVDSAGALLNVLKALITANPQGSLPQPQQPQAPPPPPQQPQQQVMPPTNLSSQARAALLSQLLPMLSQQQQQQPHQPQIAVASLMQTNQVVHAPQVRQTPQDNLPHVVSGGHERAANHTAPPVSVSEILQRIVQGTSAVQRSGDDQTVFASMLAATSRNAPQQQQYQPISQVPQVPQQHSVAPSAASGAGQPQNNNELLDVLRGLLAGTSRSNK